MGLDPNTRLLWSRLLFVACCVFSKDEVFPSFKERMGLNTADTLYNVVKPSRSRSTHTNNHEVIPTITMSEFADAADLYQQTITVAKTDVLKRIVASAMDEDGNGTKAGIMLLLTQKQEEAVYESSYEAAYHGLIEKMSIRFMEDLQADIGEKWSLEELGAVLEALKLKDRVTSTPKALPVVIDAGTKKNTSATVPSRLTSFDSIQHATKVQLVLRQDKAGRLINPNTNFVFELAKTGESVVIGSNKQGKTIPLTVSDITTCEKLGYAYKAL